MHTNLWSLKKHFLITLGFVVLSGLVNSAHFYFNEYLIHDNIRHYNQFYDNLNSLARFGEPALWFPNIQDGFPGYTFSILGPMNSGSPLFFAFSGLYYLFGIVGLNTVPIFPAYVCYFGFAVPLLFCFSILLLARLFIKDNLAILFCTVMAAFSPGVIFNLMDIGFLQTTTYPLFFLAGLVYFIRTPGKKTFIWFLLSLALTLRTLAFHSLFSPILLFPPLFLFLILSTTNRELVKCAFNSLHWHQWVLLLSTTVICALPNFWVAHQLFSMDLGRARLGEGFFDSIFNLKKGNPLEFMFSSVPFATFMWDPGQTNWMPSTSNSGIWYLGLISLPLAITGFLFGNDKLKIYLLFLFIACTCGVILSSYSPFFFPALYYIDYLRAGGGHHADVFYRATGFIIILFAAGAGLEAILSKKRAPYFVFLFTFILTSIFAAGFKVNFVSGYLTDPRFTYTLTATLIFSVLTYWLFSRDDTQESSNHPLSIIFLFFVIVDLSLVDFTFHRPNIENKNHPAFSEPNPDNIGLKSGTPNYHSETLLIAKKRLGAIIPGKEIPVWFAPKLGLFYRVHYAPKLSFEDIDKSKVPGNDPSQSLVINPDELEEGSREKVSLFARGNVPVPDNWSYQYGTILVNQKTYNQLHLTVDAAQEMILLVRDQYSPHWKATVNGNETTIFPALGFYKGLIVPAGKSTVALKFSPNLTLPLYIFSYFWIAVIFLLTKNSFRKKVLRISHWRI